MEEATQLLSMAGDAATVAVAIGFWRIDRRILRIEEFLKHKFNWRSV